MPTKLGDVFLSALRSHRGEWMTRRQIADAVGRDGSLLPYDVRLLERMVNDGLIEMRKEPAGPVQVNYFYRVKA